MSVYNGERWLHESINSVLEQTCSDFEFIIVNDGSQDMSLDIIKEFAGKDQRILVIDKPNSGLADSLNSGICQASGEWIARIDADDLCDPTRLAVQYAMAHSRNDLVLIGAGLVEINDLGQRRKTFHYPQGHQELVDRLLKMRAFFPHSSAFFNTHAVKNLGGYRQRLKRAQDFDLWLRLSEVGQIGCVAEPLVCIRHHDAQISHDEGGRRQMIDGRVALVSHFLRQKGLVDPVAVESIDSEFAVFWQFVELGVEQDKLVECRRFSGNLKVKRDMASFAGVIALLLLSVRSPHLLFRYFKEAIFGDQLALRLFNAWNGRGANCAE
jgi:glycosyltransferase involved in cell wall biosynthesis